jgi:phage major head subunit gpT-like protein
MFPQLREWIGQRHVKGLKAHGFTIRNRKFEATVEVPRDDLADDRLGIFKPVFSEMGIMSARHPDELVFGLLKDGFNVECFDGQPFFDTEHPVELTEGDIESVSNMQDGGGPAWFLLDVSRGVRPASSQAS